MTLICSRNGCDIEALGVSFYYTNFYKDEIYCYDCYDELSPSDQEDCEQKGLKI